MKLPFSVSLSGEQNTQAPGISKQWQTLDVIIDQYIDAAVLEFGSKRQAAKALGISVDTIYNRRNNGNKRKPK